MKGLILVLALVQPLLTNHTDFSPNKTSVNFIQFANSNTAKEKYVEPIESDVNELRQVNRDDAQTSQGQNGTILGKVIAKLVALLSVLWLLIQWSVKAIRHLWFWAWPVIKFFVDLAKTSKDIWKIFKGDQGLGTDTATSTSFDDMEGV